MGSGMRLIIIGILFFLNLTFMYAVETSGEKFTTKANDINRGVKKVIHKSREIVCVDHDVECHSREQNNRRQEAFDRRQDKRQEVMNRID